MHFHESFLHTLLGAKDNEFYILFNVLVTYGLIDLPFPVHQNMQAELYSVILKTVVKLL